MENHREIIDYLYERAAKLVAGSGSPIPRTLSPIISRLDSASNMESLSITLPKDEFLRYIGALIQFEKYSKPAGFGAGEPELKVECNRGAAPQECAGEAELYESLHK
jgi:hypothetical protein